ncbi:DNA-binding response OmpR family regulator [Kribbella sp. VKM Ac-2569]|uniref:response regulator transcription factor n=1 Tax=Kribbella sp. VKM Ac-2569 TaxID=2512220 RepID=UPI00102AF569|nr:response regulator transcription factor [Kribbella sp. VKM Ac-2569]RZT07834.1 DNA-binding response OmpR family regulator [Kribbella sp. VKM Ac-2569]
MRVLVVEDDKELQVAVPAALRSANLAVDLAVDLDDADEKLFVNSYDCAVFDRMFEIDGRKVDSLAYVSRRRKEGWTLPVLFLTGRDTLADRVDGFEHGGDDYLVKPFAVEELIVRVLSLVRRGPTIRPPIIRYADVELDTARRTVHRAGVLVTLRGKEFCVLEYLMSRPEQLVTRAELIDHCWDGDGPMSNVVDVTITRLRNRLRGGPDLVQAVRGQGYRLHSPGGAG